RPVARARALKQWSQLHTLSIQCFDIRTAGRVTSPAGRTVADHRTYAARSAAGVRSPRQGATASRKDAHEAAAAAAACPNVTAARYGGRPASYSSIATSHRPGPGATVTLRSASPSASTP